MKICYPVILHYLKKGIPHSSRFTPGLLRNDGMKGEKRGKVGVAVNAPPTFPEPFEMPRHSDRREESLYFYPDTIENDIKLSTIHEKNRLPLSPCSCSREGQSEFTVKSVSPLFISYQRIGCLCLHGINLTALLNFFQTL